MQMKTAFIVLSLTLLLLASCAKKAEVAPVAPVAPVAAEQEVTAIEGSVLEVDQLDKELDTSALDSLDADLAELDALDLG